MEYRWQAVVRLGPVRLRLNRGTHWIPPDFHGFFKWAMDTLALLNEFVLKVVRHRQADVKLGQIGFVRILPLALSMAST